MTAPRVPATYTIEELAALLGIGRASAYEAARRDALPVPVCRVGRRLFVLRADVDRFLAGRDAPAEPTEGRAPDGRAVSVLRRARLLRDRRVAWRTVGAR